MGYVAGVTFRSRLIALVSALVLLASACGGSASSDAQGVAASAPVAAETSSAGDDAAAEAESGPDLGLLGQGSLEGQDVVVWFWAEW